MSPVFWVQCLIGFGFAGLGIIKMRIQKENPPSRRELLVLSVLGMLCFVAAGFVLHAENN
jgi:hypothetical protein